MTTGSHRHESKDGSWFARDRSIFHPELWPHASGASLQDVRAYYLQIQDPAHDPDVEAEPWYITRPQMKANSPLCDVCQHVDFLWLAQNGTPQYRGPIVFLQNMLRNQASCNFCGLAIHALCHANGGEIRVIDMNPGNEIICCWISSLLSNSKRNWANLSIDRRLLGVPAGFIGEAGFVQPVSCNDDGRYGRLISLKADLRLINQWITTCEDGHGQPQLVKRHVAKNNRTSLQLRVIDVNKKCIVTAEHSVRYVALSYVWGQAIQLRLLMSNFRDLSTEGALSQEMYAAQLTRTIADAIVFTANLGERYLWVDALCLIQDGPDFGAEVQNMEAIYTGAMWTLVAGSANNADMPLPRMDEQLDSPVAQYVRSLGTADFAVTRPSLQVMLQHSTWDKRAWTYQESVLSNRLLVVTDYQVYFTCHHGYTFCEDSIFENDASIPDERMGHIFGPARGTMTNFEVYAGAVEAYTSRKISFHEDALDAIAGVLTSLSKSFRGEFVAALPSTELDQALLWNPNSSITRRTGQDGKPLFPSWSWVGWVGACQYKSGLALSRVRWKVSGNPTDSYMTSEELRRPAGRDSAADWHQDEWAEHRLEGWDWTGPHYWEYDSCWYEKEAPDTLYIHPVAERVGSNNIELCGAGQGRLEFEALLCSFGITGAHGTPFAHLRKPCSEGAHEICALNVYTATDEVCGTIHVPASLSTTLKPGKYDFIRLSRTHLSTDETSFHTCPFDWDEFDTTSGELIGDVPDIDEQSGYADNELGPEDAFAFDTSVFHVDVPWCVYNVMLVETVDGVSRRIGVGRVHIDAFFRNTKPVWRTIVLE